MPRLIPKLPLVIFTVLFLFLMSCSSENPGSAGDSEENARSMNSGKQNAEQAEETAVVPDTEPASAIEVLDSLYAEAEDSGDALKALESAGVESMDEDSHLVYAVLLRNEGRLDESRKELKSILSENPSMAIAWFNLALVEHASGNGDERDEALNKAIQADPTLAEAHAFKGNLAIANSQWSSAESSLKKALEYQSDTVESIVGLAWVYAKTDRIRQALPLLDSAVELEPAYVYARVDRSRVNVALRNYNDAENDLDVVIDLEPEVPWHYLDRARIRLRYFKEYEGARLRSRKSPGARPRQFLRSGVSGGSL